MLKNSAAHSSRGRSLRGQLVLSGCLALGAVAVLATAQSWSAAAPYALPTLAPIPTPVPNPPQRTTVPAPLAAPTVPVITDKDVPAIVQPTTAPIQQTDARVQLWFAAGQSYRASIPGARDIVARINGRDIQRRDIALLQTLNSGSNKLSDNQLPTTLGAIVRAQVKPIALEVAAENAGLLPSSGDLDSYIANVRKGLHSTERSALEFGAFLSGLGVPEDQFFADAEVRERYARESAVARLRELQVGSLSSDQRNAAWDSFVQTTTSAAHLEVLDANYR